jgi:ATP-dependent Clp protease adaptor protein ClpS
MSQRWMDEEGGVAAEQETKQKIDKPPMYNVLLHNDNYTTMEFVVMVLVTVFRKPESEAMRIMLDVHYKGISIAGTYPRDVAESKIQRAMQMAREAEFPFLLTMEPE